MTDIAHPQTTDDSPPLTNDTMGVRTINTAGRNQSHKDRLADDRGVSINGDLSNLIRLSDYEAKIYQEKIINAFKIIIKWEKING